MEKKGIGEFLLRNYKIKNDVLVYQNILGGVNAYVDGEIHEITNMQGFQFEIYDNRVFGKNVQ